MSHGLMEEVVGVVSGVLKRPLSPDTDAQLPLRDLGLASLRMIQLIGDLETSFGIRVEDTDVEPENFDTLEAIVRFVARKGGERPKHP